MYCEVHEMDPAVIFLKVHQHLGLHTSCVSENMAINQKGINKKCYSYMKIITYINANKAAKVC